MNNEYQFTILKSINGDVKVRFDFVGSRSELFYKLDELRAIYGYPHVLYSRK